MAIKRIQEVPTDLPHAYLYLDDVQEITAILHGAYEEHERRRVQREEEDIVRMGWRPSPRPKNEFKDAYRSGGLEMETVEDLKARGGRASHFEIVLPGLSGGGLSFRPGLNPALHCHALESEQKLAVYGKVRSVFERRALSFRNGVESLPGWFKFPLYALFMFLPALVASRSLMGKMPLPLASWGLAAWAVLGIGFAYAVMRPSRVFFAFSHERSRESSHARSRWL